MLNMLLAIIMSTYDSVVNKMPGSAETLWSQLGETSARGRRLPLVQWSSVSRSRRQGVLIHETQG